MVLFFTNGQRLTHLHVLVLLCIDIRGRLHALVVVFNRRFVSSGALIDICFHLPSVELHYFIQLKII